MGEVDLNEELKYSNFFKAESKMVGKFFFFHLMNNTAMVNSYIYKALVSTKSSTKSHSN